MENVSIIGLRRFLVLGPVMYRRSVAHLAKTTSMSRHYVDIFREKKDGKDQYALSVFKSRKRDAPPGVGGTVGP